MENGRTKYLIGMIIGLVGTAVSLFMPIGNTTFNLWQYMNSPLLSVTFDIFGNDALPRYKAAFYLCIAISVICFIIWLVKGNNEKK